MQTNIQKLINLLPNINEIEKILTNEHEAKYILNKSIQVLQKYKLAKETDSDNMEEAMFLIQALVDKCWERIHTGHFSEVSIEIRKIYGLTCYFKVLLFIF